VIAKGGQTIPQAIVGWAGQKKRLPKQPLIRFKR
jgi:hypothetical protein